MGPPNSCKKDHEWWEEGFGVTLLTFPDWFSAMLEVILESVMSHHPAEYQF
jgi:hypothetical protein